VLSVETVRLGRAGTFILENNTA